MYPGSEHADPCGHTNPLKYRWRVTRHQLVYNSVGRFPITKGYVQLEFDREGNILYRAELVNEDHEVTYTVAFESLAEAKQVVEKSK